MVIFSIWATQFIGKGWLAYLAHITDVEIQTECIECFHVVSEFRQVFPKGLSDMTPERDKYFYSYLELLCAPFPSLHIACLR